MDIQIFETGNGADILKIPGNLSIIQGFGNMPYLAMFGGNIEEDTPTRRLTTEQGFDWWGNNLILSDNQSAQFNSKTERTLNQVAINSAGRIKILDAINSDLNFMRAFAEITPDVEILGLDRIAITITIKSSTKEKDFVYIWNLTTKSINPTEKKVFDYTFDSTF